MADSHYTLFDRLKKGETLSVKDIVGENIPQEILESLVVANRVQFPYKHTTPSAISSTGEKIEEALGYPEYDEKQFNDTVSGIIDDIDELENNIAQAEDMIDELLDNMSIPPANDTVKEAVRKLDPSSKDGNITKDVFYTALGIQDHAPLMILNMDPVLTALTSEGGIEGPWTNCHEMTRAISNTWTSIAKQNLAKGNIDPEAFPKDQSTKVQKEHQEGQKRIISHIILTLWWNTLWGKFIVDLAICNPARVIFANPFDRIALFFKSFDASVEFGYEGKSAFRIPTKNQMRWRGPINKIINKVRNFLLCIPYKTPWGKDNYEGIDPLKEPPYNKLDCSDLLGGCPEESQQGTASDASAADLAEKLVKDGSDPCIDSNQLIGDWIEKNFGPKGLGLPPECLQAYSVVLSASMAAAMDAAESNPTESKASEGRNAGIRERLKYV